MKLKYFVLQKFQYWKLSHCTQKSLGECGKMQIPVPPTDPWAGISEICIVPQTLASQIVWCNWSEPHTSRNSSQHQGQRDECYLSCYSLSLSSSYSHLHWVKIAAEVKLVETRWLPECTSNTEGSWGHSAGRDLLKCALCRWKNSACGVC